MAINYLPYHPQQQFLRPPSPEDWLPEEHPAYYISDAVDQVDLSVLHARYAKDGPRNQPFHPTMMVTVLVYSYVTGCSPRASLPPSCMRMWPFGCCERALSRSIVC